MDMIRLRMLDKHFNLINTLEYINLQWTRRYYSAGEYSVQIPVYNWDQAAKYIYTPDRPEVGMVQKLELQSGGEGDLLQISGFFAEKWLDDKIIYPTLNFNGNVEDAAREIVTRYKEDIPITLGARAGLGEKIVFQNRGDELATKIYSLLETQELSFSIRHDYLTSENIFTVWRGVDRTQAQTFNNRVTFSKALGSINELFLNMDDSNFKNYALGAGQGEGEERRIVIYDASEGGYKRKLWVDARDLSQGEELTQAQYDEAIVQRCIEKLSEYQIINELDVKINPYKPGRTYLVDFDLGDKCDIIVNIENFYMQMATRIVEVAEVIKSNDLTVSLTIGNRTPTILQKAKR